MPASSRGASVSSTRCLRSALPTPTSGDAAAPAPHRKKHGVARSGRKTTWDVSPTCRADGSAGRALRPGWVRVTARNST